MSGPPPPPKKPRVATSAATASGERAAPAAAKAAQKTAAKSSAKPAPKAAPKPAPKPPPPPPSFKPNDVQKDLFVKDFPGDPILGKTDLIDPIVVPALESTIVKSSLLLAPPASQDVAAAFAAQNASNGTIVEALTEGLKTPLPNPSPIDGLPNPLAQLHASIAEYQLGSSHCFIFSPAFCPCGRPLREYRFAKAIADAAMEKEADMISVLVTPVVVAAAGGAAGGAATDGDGGFAAGSSVAASRRDRDRPAVDENVDEIQKQRYDAVIDQISLLTKAAGMKYFKDNHFTICCRNRLTEPLQLHVNSVDQGSVCVIQPESWTEETERKAIALLKQLEDLSFASAAAATAAAAPSGGGGVPPVDSCVAGGAAGGAAGGGGAAAGAAGGSVAAGSAGGASLPFPVLDAAAAEPADEGRRAAAAAAIIAAGEFFHGFEASWFQ